MSDEQQRGCPGIHSGVAWLGLKRYVKNGAMKCKTKMWDMDAI